MPIPKDISRNMLIRLIFEYNKYIQTANHEDLYLNGWRQVSRQRILRFKIPAPHL